MIQISDTARGLSNPDFIKKSIEVGTGGEDLFKKLVNVKLSHSNDDYNHIDCKLNFNNTTFLLDIKGFKVSQKYGYVLVEMLNVQGLSGWCSSKTPNTHIAFQSEEEFFIVNKKQLRSLVLEKCEPYSVDDVLRINKPTSKFSYEELKYKWLGRLHRKDVYVYITMDDLMALDHIRLNETNFTIKIKTNNFNQRFLDFCLDVNPSA